MPTSSRQLLHLAVLFSIYLLILFRWGYEFGRNDQMQTLSYAEFLHEPSLYPNDFYLQGINEHIPNERFIFSALLSPFAGHLAPISVIGHCLFALIMLGLLDKIGALFIRSAQIRWLGILMLFIPLYGIGLGGNELYYNSFFVSNVVKTIGLAGILFMLQKSYYGAFGMFAIATLLQPVVGIQLAITCSGVMLLGMWLEWVVISWRTWFAANLAYALTGGLWVIFLQTNFESDPLTTADHFFDILFIFRAPHHYLPSTWHLKDWIIEGGIIGLGTLIFSQKFPRFFLFSIISIVLCIVYFFAMEVLQLVPAGALQWFKTTIWLECFSVFAILGFLENRIESIWPKTKMLLDSSWFSKFSHASLFAIAISCLLLISFAPSKIPMEVPYDFGAQMQDDDAVKITIAAKELSPSDALFIHPIAFTELKYYGQRSAYVDYKVLVHTRAAMHIWADRVESLYGIAWDIKQDGNRYENANTYFANLEKGQLQKLAEIGVTHMLTYSDAPSINSGYPLKKIAEQGAWAIFEL